MLKPEDLDPHSWAIFAGRGQEPGCSLNVPPLLASNFVHGGDRAYARNDGMPTWESLEELIGGLERGRAIAFASGMAAIAAVFDQLQTGSRVVLPSDCYQGVTALAKRGEKLGRWSIETVELADTTGWVSVASTADLIWIETPSNPLLVVADLPVICKAPRKRGAILAVDNTFATPLNQQPLALGADVSIHSATKYIGGHSDLLAGLAVTNRDDLFDELLNMRSLAGATLGAIEAFLAVRGARTLGVRLAASQASAFILAERLEAHADVRVVRYPGLKTHPTHEVAARVLRGFGSIITFDVAGGSARADAVCRQVELIHHATSLGAVESTIERRAALAGQDHLPESLLRFSVGCENTDDLWRDLQRALEATR